MKTIASLLFLLCLVGMPVESRADLLVTIGGVTGTATNLDVTIEGSGTIPLGAANDLRYITVFPVESGTGNTNLFPSTHFLATELEGNIGDYVTSLYNFYSAPLTTPITLHNTTDSTSTQIEYLMFDDDAGATGDDFNLIFFAPDLFIEPGDSWTISGSSAFVLEKGNASVFTLGTYSFTDVGVGEFTLVLQESSAIPEPFTAVSFMMGGLLLMLFRKKVLGGNKS